MKCATKCKFKINTIKNLNRENENVFYFTNNTIFGYGK